MHRSFTPKKTGSIQNGLDNIDRSKFYIPGSILQVSVDPTNPIAFGSTPTVPIFYENGPVFHVSSEAKSIASFQTEEPLLSGWIQGGNFLKGNSVIAQENVGKGHLILFGFRPQYRAISEVTYKFLFNAPALLGFRTGILKRFYKSAHPRRFRSLPRTQVANEKIRLLKLFRAWLYGHS